MKRQERTRVKRTAAKNPVFLLALLFVILCLAALGVGAAWGLERITREAEDRFGPPSADLNTYDRVYYSWELISNTDNLLIPAGSKGEAVKFEINSGDNPSTVSQNLQEAGLLVDRQSFLNFLIYSGLDEHLQAGDYFLSPQSNPVEIARKISDANQTTVKFGFLPGMRAEEIGTLLEKSGLAVDRGRFLAWVRRPPAELLPPDLEGVATLEGLLYPDIYELDRSTDAAGLLRALLAEFDSRLSTDIRQSYTDHGLSIEQAVILASMVQKEAVVEEEQPLIASVFLNRIQAGMKFESDPTVQYALGFDAKLNTWWKAPLSLDDLTIDSPYNTYLYPGFPPGPICNPGYSALQAVAFPAETPYYYFRARCDGSGRHTFSNTLDEHLQHACPEP